MMFYNYQSLYLKTPSLKVKHPIKTRSKCQNKYLKKLKLQKNK